jgi:hypothetical protein
VDGLSFKYAPEEERARYVLGRSVSTQSVRQKGGGDKLDCKVCHRQAEKAGYCRLHAKGCQNVVKNYPVWKKALGISWKEYLSEITKNSLTGEWAKEVATYLEESGDKDDVKID